MNTKPRIVTISAPNLRPGDILCEGSRECEVLTVYRAETDRVEVGLTFRDGNRIVPWTYRLYHKIKVRRNPNPPTDFSVDWTLYDGSGKPLPNKEQRAYISLLSTRKKS